MKKSLTYVFEGPIDNISVLIYIIAWRVPGTKQLSEAMLTQFAVA